MTCTGGDAICDAIDMNRNAWRKIQKMFFWQMKGFALYMPLQVMAAKSSSLDQALAA